VIALSLGIRLYGNFRSNLLVSYSLLVEAILEITKKVNFEGGLGESRWSNLLLLKYIKI